MTLWSNCWDVWVDGRRVRALQDGFTLLDNSITLGCIAWHVGCRKLADELSSVSTLLKLFNMILKLRTWLTKGRKANWRSDGSGRLDRSRACCSRALSKALGFSFLSMLLAHVAKHSGFVGALPR